VSKQAKVHKIKAKVDPKPTKAGTKVTKIKASVPAKTAKNTTTTEVAKTTKADKAANITKVKTSAKVKTRKRSGLVLTKVFKPVILFNRYLKNSWLELKKVHWPSRKSTWAMVFAVVGYSLFFLVLVLALDNLFSYIFKLMLK
jgi:preprotein translocase, secE subunit